MEVACSKNSKFVDLMVFRNFIPKSKTLLFEGLDLAIGIKGLPGRPGIGIGHKPIYQIQPDSDMLVLKKLIGEDYIYYL